MNLTLDHHSQKSENRRLLSWIQNNVHCDKRQRWSFSHRGNRAKEGLLLPPVEPWEQLRPNVAARKNNHSLIDIEHFLRICQISKQTANFVRFCESAWPAVLTMMRWAGMCLSDWFLACHGFSHTRFMPSHRVIAMHRWEGSLLQSEDVMSWSWKESDDCSAFPVWADNSYFSFWQDA